MLWRPTGNCRRKAGVRKTAGDGAFTPRSSWQTGGFHTDIAGLIIQLIAGAIGGNVAGSVAKGVSLGGGGAGGAILTAIIGAIRNRQAQKSVIVLGATGPCPAASS